MKHYIKEVNYEQVSYATESGSKYMYNANPSSKNMNSP